MSDFQVTSGPLKLRVTGLRRTVRDLKKAGADSQDLSELMHKLGSIVVEGAQVKRVTNSLADTLRAGRGKTKAVVRMGTRRVPYAGVYNYGWPERNIEPAAVPLEETVRANMPEILESLEAGVQEILTRATSTR